MAKLTPEQIRKAKEDVERVSRELEQERLKKRAVDEQKKREEDRKKHGQ